MRMPSYLRIASGAAAVFLFSLAASAADTTSKTIPIRSATGRSNARPNLYSIEKEIALGKGLAQQIERQAKIIDEPQIAEYVNRLGQNLVRNSDAQGSFHD